MILRIPETSPHTWGKRENFGILNLGFRNIPTHVGKTAVVTGLEGMKLETSPHTWGKHFSKFPAGNEVRNIPTHVGKTLTKGFI